MVSEGRRTFGMGVFLFPFFLFRKRKGILSFSLWQVIDEGRRTKGLTSFPSCL